MLQLLLHTMNFLVRFVLGYGGPKLPNTQTKTPTTINLEGTTISLEGTTISLEGTTINLEGTTINLEGTTINLEGTTISLEGTTVQFPSICTVPYHFYFMFVSSLFYCTQCRPKLLNPQIITPATTNLEGTRPVLEGTTLNLEGTIQ